MEYTLVIDLHTKVGKEGEHYGTLVVEQSPIQAYWVHALHRHHHGQMTKAELHHHLQILHDNGFVEIDRDYVQHKDERPPKYYIILNKEHDWNINEILVVNKFSAHPVLMDLVDKLNLTGFAHRVLVDDWHTTRDWVNKRGNFQINHGANHLDLNDTNTLPGMNIARDHKRVKSLKPGMYGHKDLEETMIFMQSLVTLMFDYIAEFYNKRRVFIAGWRRRHFSAKKMRSRGFPENLLRSDSGAFLYSGLFMTVANGWYSAQCSMHRDVHNDHRSLDGADANICLSQMISMKYPNRKTAVIGRAAMNQFMKDCNGRVLERISLSNVLIGHVKGYMHARGVDHQFSRINWDEVQKEAINGARPGEDFAVIPAHANKDCYYSWFVHVYFTEVAPVYGFDEHLMVEVVYTMSLTPSAVGWRRGVRYAMHALNCGSSLNFYITFCHEMVCKHDCVANHFGHKGRHQVASGPLITHYQACFSMFNFGGLSNRANEDNCDSTSLYNVMSAGEKEGGLRNVRQLTAYDLVNVSTKIGLITNLRHCRNITVAKCTETAKRLAKYGVRTDAHRRELVMMISRELHIEDLQVVENILCETLRWLCGNENLKMLGVDTIGINQPLYQFIGERLIREEADGSRAIIDLASLRSAKPSRTYSPTYRWWELGCGRVYSVLGRDFNIYLSKNSKCLREYYNNIT